MTSALAGTGSMVRLILRRDRIRLPVWLVSILGIVGGSASAVASTYTTPAQIAAYASAVGTAPAAVAMGGPPVALDTVGGILVYETSLTALLGAALMSVFLVVRHTRADEEEGRTELLRSAVLGRYAGAVAVLLVLVAANVLLGVGVTASVVAQDVPVAGSVVYGAATTAFGLVMAAVATLAAQLMSHARAAIGLSLAVLGAAFLLRALGDTGDQTLSWLSPMGWSQQVRAFEDDRWWPLALSLVLVVVLVTVALVLLECRDQGAGVVPPRPGPADAGFLLAGPVSLAFRLQRAAILGWATGVLVMGAAFGSMIDGFEELVDSNPVFEEYFGADAAGSLEDAFLATALLIMALLAAAFAVGSVLRGRGEEAAGRLEAVLATRVSRTRWLLSQLVVTVLGAVTVLAAGGAGLGLAHRAVSGEGSPLLGSVGDALTYLPAVLVVSGLAVLLFGCWPRGALLAWAVMAFCFVVGWLGGLLQPPRWVSDLSPFSHSPAVPADPVGALPLAVLTASAAALTVAGVAGFRRRDVG